MKTMVSSVVKCTKEVKLSNKTMTVTDNTETVDSFHFNNKVFSMAHSFICGLFSILDIL